MKFRHFVIDAKLILPLYNISKRIIGCIINFSSVLAKRGSIGTSVYAATKAGIEGFTNSLAVELGPKNIRVNSICPGLVDTEMGRGMKSIINNLLHKYLMH